MKLKYEILGEDWGAAPTPIREPVQMEQPEHGAEVRDQPPPVLPTVETGRGAEAREQPSPVLPTVETVESPRNKVLTQQKLTLFLTTNGKNSAPRAEILPATQQPDSSEGCDTIGGGISENSMDIY